MRIILIGLFLCLSLLSATTGFTQDVELSPEIIRWIEEIKNVPPYDALPKPPHGCGAIRVDSTGDVFIIITKQGTKSSWMVLREEYTKEKRKITVYFAVEKYQE